MSLDQVLSALPLNWWGSAGFAGRDLFPEAHSCNDEFQASKAARRIRKVIQSFCQGARGASESRAISSPSISNSQMK